jgi:hypothetical protein
MLIFQGKRGIGKPFVRPIRRPDDTNKIPRLVVHRTGQNFFGRNVPTESCLCVLVNSACNESDARREG